VIEVKLVLWNTAQRRDLSQAIGCLDVQTWDLEAAWLERIFVDCEGAEAWKISLVHADSDWDEHVPVDSFFGIVVSYVAPVVMACNFKNDSVLILLEKIKVVCLLVFHPERACSLGSAVTDSITCVNMSQ